MSLVIVHLANVNQSTAQCNATFTWTVVKNTTGIQSTHFKTVRKTVQKKLCLNGSFTLSETESDRDTNSGFLSLTEIGSRDPSLSLCNVNIFCTVQYRHQVWNPSLYPRNLKETSQKRRGNVRVFSAPPSSSCRSPP